LCFENNHLPEGGQAEIFNVTWTHYDGSNGEYVLKVFKEGYSLRDLEKQWSCGMLQNQVGYFTNNSCHIHGATLLQNGRLPLS
jgi:hypothetical protein